MAARWSPNTKRVVAVLGVAVGALLLVQAREVVTPFLWAAVFAYVFAPVVSAAQRRSGAPRSLVVAALFAVLALAVYAIGRVVVPLVFDELNELRRTFPALIRNIEDQVVAALAGTGYESLATSLFDETGVLGQRISGMVVPIAIGLVSSIVHALIFAIALFYFLRDGPRLAGALRGLVPLGPRDELLRLIGRINTVLGHYVRGQVLLVAIMATATIVGLSVLRMPFSLLIGSLTGVLETIPIVGPITAGTIAVLVALGHPAPFGWTQVGYAAVVAVMYTVFRHVEDYFVIPQIIGRIVELHPLVIIFALLTGGAIGGLLGILVAVPVAASARIAIRYVLAKLRDEDPYRALTDAVPAPAEEPLGVTRRPA